MQTCRGARPGESIADLILIFMFAQITKEVRSVISHSPFRTTLALASHGILSAQLGADSHTEDGEAIYADDDMHGFLHPDPFFIVSAISFTAKTFVACARAHALELNFGPGKPKQ